MTRIDQRDPAFATSQDLRRGFALRPPALSRVQRNIAGSIAASLFVQGSLLVNGIATARILGVLDRGHLALLMLLATVLPILTTAGMPLAVTYWIARDPQLGGPLLRSLRRTFAGQLAATLAVHAVVLYAFFHAAPGYVQVSAGLSLLASVAIAVWSYGMAILQGNQQFKALNLSRIVSPPISAALTAGFLLTGVRGLVIITATWAILLWLTAIITGMAALRGLRHAPADAQPPSPPSVASMRGFGAKALLGSVTPLEGFQLDQATVGVFVSQRSLGIYVAAVAFTNLPRFISQNIGLVAYPHVAAGRDRRGQARAMLGFVALTLLLCGGAVAVLELALPFLVPHLFGVAFAPAIGVAEILLVSALLFGLRRVLSECARGAGRPGLGSVAEAVSLVTLVPALAVFARSGAEGVALALVVAAATGLAGMLVGLCLGPRGTRRISWRSESPSTDRVDPLVTEP